MLCIHFEDLSSIEHKVGNVFFRTLEKAVGQLQFTVLINAQVEVISVGIHPHGISDRLRFDVVDLHFNGWRDVR